MLQFKKAVALAVPRHRRQMLFLLSAFNLFALLVFLLVHAGVYGFAFRAEEGAVVLKLFLTASCMALCLHGVALAVIWLEQWLERRPMVYTKLKGHFFLLLALSLSLVACGANAVVKGIMKDGSTGITTIYSGLQPEETLLVMNGEEIHHTDIPLGESFALISKGVKGFTERAGRLAVGCALTITDSSGAVLLQEADLFTKEESFAAEEARYLKCIINTGKPMQWDQHYKVQVRFWDKWGRGSITNEVKILINGEVSQE